MTAKKAGAKKTEEENARRTTVARGVTHQWVRDTVLALPGVVEGTSYGTPAFRVNKGFICRFHQDGKSLVVPLDMDDREILMRVDPESFYITDHYRNYPYVLARLATVDRDALRDLLEEAWRKRAPHGGAEAADRRARARGLKSDRFGGQGSDRSERCS